MKFFTFLFLVFSATNSFSQEIYNKVVSCDNDRSAVIDGYVVHNTVAPQYQIVVRNPQAIAHFASRGEYGNKPSTHGEIIFDGLQKVGPGLYENYSQMDTVTARLVLGQLQLTVTHHRGYSSFWLFGSCTGND